MKSSRMWMTAVTVLALSSSLAVAGPGEYRGNQEGKGGSHERGMGLADKLNLTDAQRQQWQSIQTTFRQENGPFLQSFRQTRSDLEAARAAGDTAKQESLRTAMKAQHEQMKQLREPLEQKLMAILNTDQRAQFQALKAEREAHRGNRNRQQN